MHLSLVRTYVVIGEHPSLFLVQTYVGGPLDVFFVNSTQTIEETLDVRYFSKIPFGPRCTRNPLDYCVKVPNVR
jgi:hypothetical protein